VVATSADGPSLLIEDGVTGYLAPVEQPVLLAAAIRGALADRQALGRVAAAGEGRFLRDFTKDAVVGQYRAFFERIIA
jgi:glycosyltransferase involved in cell wall biosynthesis